jgi:hypothetical protein
MQKLEHRASGGLEAGETERFTERIFPCRFLAKLRCATETGKRRRCPFSVRENDSLTARCR